MYFASRGGTNENKALREKGVTLIKNVTFIQHGKLTNVVGRIRYISDEKKQENLYAVYETVPRKYWKDLAKENQSDFRRSGTSGNCIEARELIIALPKEMTLYDPDELLRYFVESYRKKYGTECIAALHHNKRKTNYHIHLIYSERQQLEEPMRKIATRNMYFDPEGRHVRTKKEATAEGKLLPGYSMIPKGEVYEEHLFDKKNPLFKQKSFTEDVKVFFTDLMNRQLSEPNQMQVFPKNSPFLPTKKIGKNNPKAEFIEETNRLKDEWNKRIWTAYRNGAPKEGLITVKRELISKPATESIREAGGKGDPGKYNSILVRAIAIVAEMCRLLSRQGRETWAEAWGKALTKLMDMATEQLAGRRIDIKKDTRHRTMER